MSRPKKKRIELNRDSLSNLLQEIYNECVEQRSVALTQRNKILKDVEQLEDVGMVGKVTTDLLKIVDSAIDKKLALAKLQAGLLSNTQKDDDLGSDITPDQMKFLRETLKLGEDDK